MQENPLHNRQIGLFKFHSLQDLTATESQAELRPAAAILSRLSIVALCRESDLMRLNYDPLSADSIIARNSAIQAAFNTAESEISALPPKAKKDYLTFLLTDCFKHSRSFPGVKGFYVDSCLDAFGLGNYTNREIASAARDSILLHGFDYDWQNSRMPDLLSRGFKQKDIWNTVRFEYLIDLLSDRTLRIDLPALLDTPNMKGMHSLLKNSPELLEQLRDCHRAHLLSQLRVPAISFDPGVVLKNLEFLEDVGFLREREFRKRRGLCLRNKLVQMEIDDIPAYLAFFERDVENPDRFAGNELAIFKKLKDYASATVINGVSTALSSRHINAGALLEFRDKLKLVSDIFIGDLTHESNRHFTKHLSKVVLANSKALFHNYPVSAHLPPDIFTHLLPAEEQQNVARDPELSKIIKGRLFYLVKDFNKLSKEVQDRSTCEGELYERRLFALYTAFLPCIERLDVYRNLFNCTPRYTLQPLSEATISDLRLRFDYSPGQFRAPAPGLQPCFSILNWHELNLRLTEMIDCGELSDACGLFNRLYSMTRDNLAPVSKESYRLTIPNQYRRVLETVLGKIISNGDPTD